MEFFSKESLLESYKLSKSVLLIEGNQDNLIDSKLPEVFRLSVSNDMNHVIFFGEVININEGIYLGNIFKDFSLLNLFEDTEIQNSKIKEVSTDENFLSKNGELYTALSLIEKGAYSSVFTGVDSILSITGIGEGISVFIWGLVTLKNFIDFYASPDIINGIGLAASVICSVIPIANRYFSPFIKNLKIIKASSNKFQAVRKYIGDKGISFLGKIGSYINKFFSLITGKIKGFIKSGKSTILTKYPSIGKFLDKIDEIISKVKSKVGLFNSKINEFVSGVTRYLKNILLRKVGKKTYKILSRFGTKVGDAVKKFVKFLYKRGVRGLKNILENIKKLIMDFINYLLRLMDLKDIMSFSNLLEYTNTNKMIAITEENISLDKYYYVFNLISYSNEEVFGDDLVDKYGKLNTGVLPSDEINNKTTSLFNLIIKNKGIDYLHDVMDENNEKNYQYIVIRNDDNVTDPEIVNLNDEFVAEAQDALLNDIESELDSDSNSDETEDEKNQVRDKIKSKRGLKLTNIKLSSVLKK